VHRTMLQPLIERLEIAALKAPGVVVWLALSGLIVVLVMLAGFNIIEFLWEEPAQDFVNALPGPEERSLLAEEEQAA
jgi:hypothetical protein